MNVGIVLLHNNNFSLVERQNTTATGVFNVKGRLNMTISAIEITIDEIR